MVCLQIMQGTNINQHLNINSYPAAVHILSLQLREWKEKYPNSIISYNEVPQNGIAEATVKIKNQTPISYLITNCHQK